MNPALPYYLGCPSWSHREWMGKVFRADTQSTDLLRQYSRIFNTVEGNTLFYALPPMATVERWMAESSSAFRFAPKFPKTISHERRLSHAEEETASFTKVLEALAHGNKLGVSFLQLPPSFNINNLDTLSSFLKKIPRDFRYAVEPRHISFFDHGENEKRLDDLLETLDVDKVIFDTRSLNATEPDDDAERYARERKPNLPVRQTAIAKNPVLRFVGKNDIAKNEAYIKEWAPILNKWILEGRKPYVFAHAGDDLLAPYVARALHAQLKRINPLLPELPEFESDRAKPEQKSEQLDLF